MINVIKTPYRILIPLVYRGAFNRVDDETYIKMLYRILLGEMIDLSSPMSFNEKIQWLKLYDRQSSYTVMVDKYKVREYVAEKLGNQYLIPLLGVWDSPGAIDFTALPDKFVLKCNHNSGTGMCICTDKANLDIKKVTRELKRGLKENYYLLHREWPYKDVPRKIIAEQYMKSDAGGLTDYKIHCFNGEPKLILVCKDRFVETGLTEDFFSEEWEHLDIRRPSHPNAVHPIPKPDELSQMLMLAKILSEGIPFVRVDFYIIDHKIYFSELTFFPAAGFEKFIPDKWDRILGDWLELPKTVESDMQKRSGETSLYR